MRLLFLMFVTEVCVLFPFKTEMAKNQGHFDPVVASTKITVSNPPLQALLNPVLFASLSPFPQPAPVRAAVSCQSTPEIYQAFVRIKNWPCYSHSKLVIINQHIKWNRCWFLNNSFLSVCLLSTVANVWRTPELWQHLYGNFFPYLLRKY